MNITRTNSVEETLIKKIVKEIILTNNIEIFKINNIYTEEEIGSGAQAKVYKAKLFDKDITLKVYKNMDWKSFGNELVILSNLKHTNIPAFLGIVEDNISIGLIFEYISGVPMSSISFTEFNDNVKLKLIKDLCNIVEYIHSKSFIHRDIKPENIIIDNNYNLYLIDFGISKVLNQENGYTYTRIKGTIAYASPEMFTEVGYNNNQEKICGISIKSDVWSVGVLISYLYSGYFPWSNKYKSSDPSITNLLIQKTPFPIPDNIKDERIKKIIELCTVIDVDSRAYIQDINSMLSSM
jgi:serine/threonine protein kinase